MISLGAGIGLGGFSVSVAAVVISVLRTRNGKNGNGGVAEKLCGARRETISSEISSLKTHIDDKFTSLETLVKNGGKEK